MRRMRRKKIMRHLVASQMARERKVTRMMKMVKNTANTRRTRRTKPSKKVMHMPIDVRLYAYVYPCYTIASNCYQG